METNELPDRLARLENDPRFIVFGPGRQTIEESESELSEYIKSLKRGTAIPNTNSMKDLFDLLKQHGGKIVTSSDVNHLEIADARVDGRMWVDADGIGYVFMPKDYASYVKDTRGMCIQTN